MERYWDGRGWTDDARPLAGGPAPLSGPAVGVRPGGGWDWMWLIFSLKGRAHRAHYWAVSAAAFGYVIGAATILVAAEDTGSGAAASDGGTGSQLLAVVLTVLYFVLLWAALAAGVKRFHDRDKPGAWMLIVLVPVGFLWVLIECGFLPGTDGPNRYGGDPRRATSLSG